MNINTLITEFRSKICEKVDIIPEGIDRYLICTPFTFDDGDNLVVVLKQSPKGWIITDEAHTYMHLSYEFDMKDLERGTRQKIISSSLSMYNLEENDGEIFIKVDNNLYGDALFNFIQGLLRITDIKLLSRERVKSTFIEDFKLYLTEKVPSNRRVFEYKGKEYDLEGKYTVDCLINGVKKPLYVFAINNDDKCRDATINCLQFERWGRYFHSMAIFEDQETISRKVLARFSDVCEKQFSSLYLNRDRIEKYIKEYIAA